MKFYLAPMQGVTDYIYRNAYEDFFHNIDKYFTPFITATPNKKFKSREYKELAAENNRGLQMVPQILANNGDYFIEISKTLKAQFGYEELNLNLGCPSGTVVAKRKGSGFLADPKELDRFLDRIFEAGITEISLKTRIGIESPGEFEKLLAVYRKYPMKEFIVHPRVQKDYYKNTPNLEAFAQALEEAPWPVCYNGDIFSEKDYRMFHERFPMVETLMCGRGIVRNPWLIDGITETGRRVDKRRMREFHDRIYKDYQEILSGEKTVLFRMKELWSYMIESFTNPEKYWKKIKKAERLAKYEETIERLFLEQELKYEKDVCI